MPSKRKILAVAAALLPVLALGEGSVDPKWLNLGHESRISGFYSADGSKLVIYGGTWDPIQCFDSQSGALLWSTAFGRYGTLIRPASSGNLFCALYYNKPSLFDLETGRRLVTYSFSARDFCLSPDNTQLATIYQNVVSLYDQQSGGLIRSFTVSGSDNDPFINWNASGTKLLATQHNAQVYDLATSTLATYWLVDGLISMNSKESYCLSFARSSNSDPDKVGLRTYPAGVLIKNGLGGGLFDHGRQAGIATATSYSTYDLNSFQTTHQIPINGSYATFAVDPASGDCAILPINSSFLQRVNLKTATVTNLVEMPQRKIDSLHELHPTNELMAICSNQLSFFDRATGQMTRKLDLPMNGVAAGISIDGQRILWSVGQYSPKRVLDTVTGQELRTFADLSSVWSLSPDGRTAITSIDNKLKTYDVDTGSLTATYSIPGVYGIQWFSDDWLLLISASDFSAYNLRTGERNSVALQIIEYPFYSNDRSLAAIIYSEGGKTKRGVYKLPEIIRVGTFDEYALAFDSTGESIWHRDWSSQVIVNRKISDKSIIASRDVLPIKCSAMLPDPASDDLFLAGSGSVARVDLSPGSESSVAHLNLELSGVGSFDRDIRIYFDLWGRYIDLGTTSATLPAGSSSVDLTVRSDRESYWPDVRLPGWITRSFAFDSVMDRDRTFTLQMTPGDCDSDGTVSLFDYLILSERFGASASDPTYTEYADFNRDGNIDLVDYILLTDHFDQT